MKVGLLGGGITSLAIGYFLKKPYEILEKEDRCGGLCRSLVDQGYTFDVHGAHIFFSKNKRILELEKKLVGRNLKTRFRKSYVYFKGRLLKYPFENDLGSLDKKDIYECLYSYLFNTYPKPENLEDWFYYTFGKGISEMYLIPYNKKIWKTDLKEMGMEWVERIPKPPKEDIIKSALGISTEGYKHQLNFLYPEMGGAEAVIKAFEKYSKDEILLDFEIDGIFKKKGRWILTSNGRRREYDEIVSTIPLFDLFRCLKNIHVPRKVGLAVSALEYRQLITVLLGLNSVSLTDAVAIYFPDKGFMPHRITFPPNFSPKTVPKGHFSVMAEITVPPDLSYLRMDKNKIYTNVINGLVRRKLIQPESVVYKNMWITQYAYPVYKKGYVKNMKIIRDFLNSINLYICGRFGEFQYINTDVCIEKAEAVALMFNKYKD